jgi:hypothetical protein
MLPHPFLSDEWMTAARAIYDEHADDAPEFPHRVRINLVATGVPFGEGRIKAYIDTTDGQLRMDLGELERPDTTVTTDYDTARLAFVVQDQQAVMQAFLGGRIKIQGDMTKLLLLQSVAPDGRARSVATLLKDITE